MMLKSTLRRVICILLSSWLVGSSYAQTNPSQSSDVKSSPPTPEQPVAAPTSPTAGETIAPPKTTDSSTAKPAEGTPPPTVDNNASPPPVISNEPPTILMLGLGTKIRFVGHPADRYTVRPGDTLMSVVGRFVADPLLVRDFWDQKLPQVRPGDLVSLLREGNLYMLQIKKGREVKLSPMVREIETTRGIPLLPIEAIQQFLNRPKIFTEEELEESGYIIANNNRTLLTTIGAKIYARGLDAIINQRNFMIIRPGQVFRNRGEDDEPLAFEAIYLGDATLETLEDPVTLRVTAANNEIQVGDRLFPLETVQTISEDFHPHIPRELEGGQIIGLVGGFLHSAQYQVVVINKGSEDGIERGHVVVVNQRSRAKVEDPITGDKVDLPGQYSGTLLIFKVFEKISYALVMKSVSPINVFDDVSIP